MEATKAAGGSGEPRKENKMGVMPIPKLLLTMSLPMIISMIVQALTCRGQHFCVTDQ